MRYGVFIGRCQPFHMGHQAVINEILLDGLTPIIVLGSSQLDRDMDKNPLSFTKRTALINTIYPNTYIKYVYSEDHKDWDLWYANLMLDLEQAVDSDNLKEDIVIYYNEKEVDRTDFRMNGVDYENTWYTDVFKDAGFTTQKIKLAERSDLKIDSNARDIRHDLEGYKHLMDARVYNLLREWGWE